jgi:diguanylate cyclase (GGDEF)-like protein
MNENMKEVSTILVVEDHQDMLMMIRKFLSEHGFKVIGAETGEIALKKYRKKPPNLILMDIMLPGISGIETTKRIRGDEKSTDYIPIIMITAKNKVEDIVEGLNAGADDYIIKPFKFDELIARIKSSIRTKDLYDKLRDQTSELKKANQTNYSLNQSLISKNKELRKKIYDLHNIFEISFELHAILDLHRLINSTLLTLVGQFSCKSALFLFIQKKNEQRLSVFNSKGYYESDTENLRIEKSDVLYKYCLSNRDPILFNKLPKEIENSNAIKNLKNLQIELISPIIVHEKEAALLCLGDRVKSKKYSQNELELLGTVNNIISIAVSNAHLYDEVIQLSYTDGMTELHNYRYFEMRLKEEVMRHSRTKQKVSLIILDVDFFKNYNDTLGHQAGDGVLKTLGIILKETVRENDIVARYGGEEFAVILPGVAQGGAIILADRIREKVEKQNFPNQEIQPKGSLTISLGVATLPDQAKDANDLIYKADTALYTAKRSGRNRVIQFSNTN